MQVRTVVVLVGGRFVAKCQNRSIICRLCGVGMAGRDEFRLGPWLVQPSLNRVSRNGTSLRLEPKVVGVLVCLAGRAGENATLLSNAWTNYPIYLTGRWNCHRSRA